MISWLNLDNEMKYHEIKERPASVDCDLKLPWGFALLPVFGIGQANYGNIS